MKSYDTPRHKKERASSKDNPLIREVVYDEGLDEFVVRGVVKQGNPDHLPVRSLLDEDELDPLEEVKRKRCRKESEEEEKEDFIDLISEDDNQKETPGKGVTWMPWTDSKRNRFL